MGRVLRSSCPMVATVAFIVGIAIANWSRVGGDSRQHDGHDHSVLSDERHEPRGVTGHRLSVRAAVRHRLGGVADLEQGLTAVVNRVNIRARCR